MLNFQHLNSHEPFFLILNKVDVNYNLSSTFMDKILVNFREEINEKIASPISLSMLDKNLQEL